MSTKYFTWIMALILLTLVGSYIYAIYTYETGRVDVSELHMHLSDYDAIVLGAL